MDTINMIGHTYYYTVKEAWHLKLGLYIIQSSCKWCIKFESNPSNSNVNLII